MTNSTNERKNGKDLLNLVSLTPLAIIKVSWRLDTSIKYAPVQKIQILVLLAGVGWTDWQVKSLHSSEERKLI